MENEKADMRKLSIFSTDQKPCDSNRQFRVTITVKLCAISLFTISVDFPTDFCLYY